MSLPLENHALVAVAALAAEHLDPDETIVHLIFTEEELEFVRDAEVRIGRGLEPHPDQLMVSVRYRSAR